MTYLRLLGPLTLALVLYLAIALYYVRKEFSAYQESVEKEKAALYAEATAREVKLSHDSIKINDTATAQTQSINEHYQSLLNERLSEQQHTNASSDSPTTSTSAVSSTTRSQPSAPSGALYQAKLKRCENRLLYEAKEYDILATHYNALLSLYENARGGLNHGQERALPKNYRQEESQQTERTTD